jgi:UDP-glucose 4-epimerase
VLALARLEAGAAPFVLNCGYGRGASVRQVIKAVERAAGRALPVVSAPRRAGDPPSLVARADRIRNVLGWRPAHDHLDLIARTALSWERKLRSSIDKGTARTRRVQH